MMIVMILMMIINDDQDYSVQDNIGIANNEIVDNDDNDKDDGHRDNINNEDDTPDSAATDDDRYDDNYFNDNDDNDEYDDGYDAGDDGDIGDHGENDDIDEDDYAEYDNDADGNDDEDDSNGDYDDDHDASMMVVKMMMMMVMQLMIVKMVMITMLTLMIVMIIMMILTMMIVIMMVNDADADAEGCCHQLAVMPRRRHPKPAAGKGRRTPCLRHRPLEGRRGPLSPGMRRTSARGDWTGNGARRQPMATANGKAKEGPRERAEEDGSMMQGSELGTRSRIPCYLVASTYPRKTPRHPHFGFTSTREHEKQPHAEVVQARALGDCLTLADSPHKALRTLRFGTLHVAGVVH